MNRMAVFRHHRSLDNAIHKEFGSWENAVQAAGIDPDSVGLRRRWSREKVLLELRRRARARLSVRFFAVQQSDKALSHAVRRYFSSWGEAMECMARLTHPSCPSDD